MSDESLLGATAAAFWTSLPIGAAIGIALGPLRLAGTDFSKWFADPGEISEGNDHTWIGMMKWTALHTVRWLLGAAAAILFLCALASYVAGWWQGPWRHEVISYDLFRLGTSVATLFVWGLLVGIALTQWTALHTSRWRLWAVLLILLVCALASYGADWWQGPWRHEVISYDLCRLGTAIATFRGWGFIVGIALSQWLAEMAWRRGLERTDPRPQPGHRLARHHAARSKRPPEPTLRRRRLIICCDGTWNSPLQKRETNVVALLRAIKPMGQRPRAEQRRTSEPIPQIVHYHLGVGTGNFIDRMIGGGAGVGLSNSVKACYGFLVDNYQPGDEILLFGFSRGAYVVRSLAGMIGCVGLLRKSQMHRFIEAWDYYTLPPGEQTAQQAAFRRTFAKRRRNIEVLCVGVWDTVGALGIPGTRFCSQAFAFHQTKLGRHVRHAFQALAIDERRGNFQPAIWTRQTNDKHRPLEQMWFPGVHSNIGGGYDEHGLADTALLWMLSRLDDCELLDVNRGVIRASLARSCAEFYAQGKLQDSRTLFWKAIASPIPRPVCITDPNERVHDSALARPATDPSDPYADVERRRWLRTVAIAPRNGYETDPTFQVPCPGTQVTPAIDPKSGMCVRMTRWMFGE